MARLYSKGRKKTIAAHTVVRREVGRVEWWWEEKQMMTTD